ncbi:MAG: hypothetical protein ABFD07_12305 [Methanobacterium sp.]
MKKECSYNLIIDQYNEYFDKKKKMSKKDLYKKWISKKEESSIGNWRKKIGSK